MVNNTARLNGIQLLRAIAVLLVVHCHILDRQIGMGGSIQESFFYLQNFGAVGVDIFFVISGFIITIVAIPYSRQARGAGFFIKRILRVAPLYWLVSLLAVFLGYRRNGTMVEMDALAKTFLFYPFIGNSPRMGPVVFQGWTLSFELLFYTVTALAIKLSGIKFRPAVILFFLGCVLLNYILGNRYELLIFLGNGIMLEFLLGVGCGWLFLSSIRLSVFQANALIITGTVLLLATLILGYGGISESGNTIVGSLSLPRSALWGLPAALLVAGIAMKEKLQPLQVYRIWIAIGNASFSIYLIHVLIIGSLYVRWVKWGVQGKLQPDLQVLITLSIITGSGYLFYLLVERPLLNKLKSLTASTGQPEAQQ